MALSCKKALIFKTKSQPRRKKSFSNLWKCNALHSKSDFPTTWAQTKDYLRRVPIIATYVISFTLRIFDMDKGKEAHSPPPYGVGRESSLHLKVDILKKGPIFWPHLFSNQWFYVYVILSSSCWLSAVVVSIKLDFVEQLPFSKSRVMSSMCLFHYVRTFFYKRAVAGRYKPITFLRRRC